MLDIPVGDSYHAAKDFLTSIVKTANLRPGMRDTPLRLVRAFEFWTSGYEQNPRDILKTFDDGGERYDELITVAGIPCYSHCEHHLTPFFGVAHVGYIPANKQIVGLSKFARLVDCFARRLQVQERLTWQIAEAIQENLQPIAVGVVLRCRHLCMESRGVQKPGTITYTSAMLGEFKNRANPSARAEFLQFVARADEQAGKI